MRCVGTRAAISSVCCAGDFTIAVLIHTVRGVGTHAGVALCAVLAAIKLLLLCAVLAHVHCLRNVLAPMQVWFLCAVLAVCASCISAQ